MTKTEKVTKALDICLNGPRRKQDEIIPSKCKKCAYHVKGEGVSLRTTCLERLLRDTLEVLRSGEGYEQTKLDV